MDKSQTTIGTTQENPVTQEKNTMLSVQDSIQKNTYAMTEKCYSAVKWIGSVLWLLVPVLLVIILVSVMINSFSTQSWKAALKFEGTVVDIDFLATNSQEIIEMEETLQGLISHSVFQKCDFQVGATVIVDSDSSEGLEKGVYIIAPSNQNCENISDCCGTLLFIHSLDPETKYRIRKGYYRNQVFQPSSQTNENVFCGSQDQKEGTGCVFFKSSELKNLSGQEGLVPDLPEKVEKVILLVDSDKIPVIRIPNKLHGYVVFIFCKNPFQLEFERFADGTKHVLDFSGAYSGTEIGGTQAKHDVLVQTFQGTPICAM